VITSPTSTSPTTATPTSIITTTTSAPYPTQTGIVSDCNNYYLVSSGDTCESIESKFGIFPSEFEAWNPAINSGEYSTAPRHISNN
jgi:LysM repeat protein